MKIIVNEKNTHVIADEGKLLYLSYELEELGKEAMGVPNICVPANFDLNNIIEK